MKLDKTIFDKALALVSPALAVKDSIEQLVCVWFDGRTVRAFNNVIGMQVPLASELKGGVRGKSLIDLSAKSAGKEIDFKPGTDLKVSIGSTRIALSLMPDDTSIWPGVPTTLGNDVVVIDAEFLTNLKDCLISVGKDTDTEEGAAVTVAEEDDLLSMYASDRKTITWSAIPRPENWNTTMRAPRIVIPAAFCQQLVKLAKPGDLMQIDDNSLVAKLANDVMLFGRLVSVEKETDFLKIIKGATENMAEVFPIPAGLAPALARASVLVGQSPEQKVWLSVDKAAMLVHTQGPMGEMKDEIDLAAGTNVAPAKAAIIPSYVLRGLDHANEMFLSQRCIVMLSPAGLVHLIAAYTD